MCGCVVAKNLHHSQFGCDRYKVVVEIPVQKALFRVLPASLREGKEISTTAVLFTQGINEQQSLADTCVALGDQREE